MRTKGYVTGMLGVYLTAAELTQLGFIVSPTSRSAFGADLLGGPFLCSVMAGLVPAIHDLDELIVKIVPTWVGCENQAYFPGSWPVLHVVLALDRGLNVRVVLDIDEPFQSIAFGEAVDHALAVLPDAAREVIGHPGVQRTVGPVCHDVHPSPFHRARVERQPGQRNNFVDGRDKPGHDDVGVASEKGRDKPGHDGCSFPDV